MRVVLLNLGSASLEAAKAALAGEGYEITITNARTTDEVLALTPEVLITEATLFGLSCGGIITQLKFRPDRGSLPKVLMIVQGGALERAHALDFGTDDVISFPFDAVEFAAKIRTQVRERLPRERHAGIVVETLDGTVGKRRLRLIPAIFALSVLGAFAGVLTAISARGSRKDTLQLRAEITRLHSGSRPEGELLRRIEQARGSIDRNPRSDSVVRDSLRTQSENLRERVAEADGADVPSLKQQLLQTENRLGALERENKIAETVIQKYGPSVCLLHVVVGFVDKQSGSPIRLAMDATGKPQVDGKGMAQLDVGGSGPNLRIDVFGTGFLAGRDRTVLTNHHVVEPWWNDEELKQLLDHDVDPYVLSYDAYFPGHSAAIGAKLDRISSRADLATLKLETPVPFHAELLELDDRGEASVTGEAVVLIGYPTGVEGILARAGSEVAQKIAGSNQNVSQIMLQMASQQLIRPTTTQGHIGDVLNDTIVYDAATTFGGSGGPLFNRQGKVIGVNFAVIKGFGGSNLAVPARQANELFK
jgi:S1-C subfamily serine protease